MKIAGHVKAMKRYQKTGELLNKTGKIHVFHNFTCCVESIPFCDCSPKIKLDLKESIEEVSLLEYIHYHKDKVYTAANFGVRSISTMNSDGSESGINFVKKGEEYLHEDKNN